MKKNVKRIGQCGLSAALIMSLVLGNSPMVDAKKISKMESVYVTAGADGTTGSVTVSDWLKGSGEGKGVLKDQSNLTDIKNVKGEESFTQTGSDIQWNLNGNDIYYQGKTTEELPVDMKVTYKLDGEEIQAKDLLGKSGKVEIHVSYTNKSKQKKDVDGKKIEIYTPFVMITGMILSSDVFHNIEVDHGRVINDGSNNIVVGLGVPGMGESLDLEEEAAKKIPEEFTVTADAKDFSMGNTFTFASPNLLNEMDLDEVEQLEELEEKLDDLTAAAEKLVDGSHDLMDNMELFSDKMGELKKSVATFKKNGVDKLADGIATLAKGAPELGKGVKEYTAGVNQFAKGTVAYVDGAKQITDGCSTLYGKVKDIPEQMKTFETGLKTYTAGVDKMGTKENVEKMKAGAKAVADGIGTINTNLATLEKTYDTSSQLIEGLKASGADATLVAQLEAVLNGQKAAIQKLQAGTSDTSELKQGAITVSGSVNTIMDGLGQLSSSSSQLTTATSQLSEGMPELVAGVKTLKEGGEKLSKNNSTLKSSSQKIVKASKKLNKSVKKVKSGVNTLNKGGKSLKKASSQLVSGVNKLSSASDKLSNGSEKLADGMGKFNEDAIMKLNTSYEDKVKSMQNRLKAIAEAGKDYKSFTGTSGNMDGEVKFIIETDSIEKDD